MPVPQIASTKVTGNTNIAWHSAEPPPQTPAARAGARRIDSAAPRGREHWHPPPCRRSGLPQTCALLLRAMPRSRAVASAAAQAARTLPRRWRRPVLPGRARPRPSLPPSALRLAAASPMAGLGRALTRGATSRAAGAHKGRRGGAATAAHRARPRARTVTTRTERKNAMACSVRCLSVRRKKYRKAAESSGKVYMCCGYSLSHRFLVTGILEGHGP
jgi:hypothetical protein